MSTFGIIAFIAMPILGGLIAWAGDVIGYRLGKSRRSLFGLRPRSTARLIGVAVGVILPLLSLGLAMLASNDAKVALLHLDVLRRVQSDLEQSNAKLQKQTEALRGQIAAADEEAKKSALHSAQLRGSLRATARQLVEADQRLGAAQNRLRNAQHDVADLRSARDTLARARDLLHTEVGLLKQASQRLEGDVRAAKAKLGEVKQALAAVDNQLTKTEAALNASEAEAARQKAEVNRQKAALGSPVIYESGQELLRWPVEVGDTKEQTEARLLGGLAAASAVAASAGAQPGENGLAVRLVKGLPPTASVTGERDIIARTAGVLQEAGKRKFVLIIRAVRRLHQGEMAQAQVEFYLLPYVVAFARDEVIASVVIDGSQSRGDIFSQLWNLITKVVRREAGEHGLLRDPETGQFGSLPANQLLQALEAVAAGHGPVTVRVRAEKDTYITDPLAIKIEVGEQKPGAGHVDGTGG